MVYTLFMGCVVCIVSALSLCLSFHADHESKVSREVVLKTRIDMANGGSLDMILCCVFYISVSVERMT